MTKRQHVAAIVWSVVGAAILFAGLVVLTDRQADAREREAQMLTGKTLSAPVLGGLASHELARSTGTWLTATSSPITNVEQSSPWMSSGGVTLFRPRAEILMTDSAFYAHTDAAYSLGTSLQPFSAIYAKGVTIEDGVVRAHRLELDGSPLLMQNDLDRRLSISLAWMIMAVALTATGTALAMGAWSAWLTLRYQRKSAAWLAKQQAEVGAQGYRTAGGA